MKTLTFTLTEENRKLNNVTLPLAWDVAVKTIALTRFKAGTLIFDRRDLNDVDFILNDIMPKSSLAVGKLVGVHANLESIIVEIEPLDNERGRILTKVYDALDEATFYLSRGNVIDPDLKVKFQEVKLRCQQLESQLKKLNINIKYAEGNPVVAVSRILTILKAVL